MVFGLVILLEVFNIEWFALSMNMIMGKFSNCNQYIKSEMMKEIINFVDSTKSTDIRFHVDCDRDIQCRVFAVNKYLHIDDGLRDWMDGVTERDELEFVGFAEMRENCMDPEQANLWNKYHLIWDYLIHEYPIDATNYFRAKCNLVFNCSIYYALIPLYVLSRMVLVLYPIIVIVYFIVDVVKAGSIDNRFILQLMMIMFYCLFTWYGVQKSVYSCKIYWNLWHIGIGVNQLEICVDKFVDNGLMTMGNEFDKDDVGDSSASNSSGHETTTLRIEETKAKIGSVTDLSKIQNPNALRMKIIDMYYYEYSTYGEIKSSVLEVFGENVGNIIMSYHASFQS